MLTSNHHMGLVRKVLSSWLRRPLDLMSLSTPMLPVLGAALGDALGAGVEGGRALARAMSEDPDGVGRRFWSYSPYGFAPGELTDDTQMTWACLCACSEVPSLDEGGRSYAEAIGRAYRSWYESGPPDVGGTTAAALGRDGAAAGFEIWTGSEAGNGSLMRASANLAAGYRGAELLHAAALDSALTHADPRCVAACVWYAHALERALVLGNPVRMTAVAEDALQALETAPVLEWVEPLARTGERGDATWQEFERSWPGRRDEVTNVVLASLRGDHVDCRLQPWTEWPTGYVLDSLGQAVWVAVHAPSADEGLRLSVVHGGRDADTIAAIAGGLLGARFGRAALEQWDHDLLSKLRLGHQWPGIPTKGSFVELLVRHEASVTAHRPRPDPK